ncbi:hypothetical protein E4U52_005908 [Claviceps spartinae]|nr:hypothetical protein E4U52_005908 [Claviceps spartinae]
MILADLISQASHNPVLGLTIDSAGNAVSSSHRDFGNLREQLSLFWGQVHVDREHLDSQGLVNKIIGSVVGMAWKDGTATHGASDLL